MQPIPAVIDGNTASALGIIAAWLVIKVWLRYARRGAPNGGEHRQVAGFARFKARDEASQGEKNAKVGIQSFGPKPQHRMRKM